MGDLSQHFSLYEFTRSQTAAREGIDNTPGHEELANILAQCVNILEPVRALFNATMGISSGFRCLWLNRALPGGASNDDSKHIKGLATDFWIAGVNCRDVCKAIQESGIQFDQLILEYVSEENPDGVWVHISYSDKPRNQVLTVVKTPKGKSTSMGLKVL